MDLIKLVFEIEIQHVNLYLLVTEKCEKSIC